MPQDELQYEWYVNAAYYQVLKSMWGFWVVFVPFCLLNKNFWIAWFK